jgi:hypothetical protein
MPITEDHGGFFKFAVTQRLLDFFDEHRIRTTHAKFVHRWKPRQTISATRTARFSSHVVLLSGDSIDQIDAFSYSFSSLGLSFNPGRYCSISWNVKCMGPEHPLNHTTSSEILYKSNGFFADILPSDWQFLPHRQNGGVSVGHDVWIGQDVLIKRGVTIGTGAVVAAGAVVVKDVAPYDVVGGVPARHIKWRFDEALRKRLLASQWWRYAIHENAQLPWSDPSALVDAIDRASPLPFVSDLGLVRDVIAATD